MKPDAGLVVAVQRNQTGADTHKLNNLLHLYMCACYTRNHTLADRAKHKLMAVLIEKEWKAREFRMLTDANRESEACGDSWQRDGRRLHRGWKDGTS